MGAGGKNVQGKVQLKDYTGPGAGTASSAKKAVSDNVEALAEKILKALAKSHRFFAEILELFPKESYGRIAQAIGKLNQQGKITEDGEGKYQLTAKA